MPPGTALQAEGWPEVVLRSAPGQSPGDGQVVAKVPNGENVEVLQKQAGCVKVKWKKFEGWAKEQNVQLESAEGDAAGLSQGDFAQTKDDVYSVGAWEFKYRGRWKVFRSEERMQLDRIYKPESCCSMDMGPKKMQSTLMFLSVKGAEGVLGSWKITATTENYAIRREPSAKELAEVARTAMRECETTPVLAKYCQPGSIQEILDRHRICQKCSSEMRKPSSFLVSKAACVRCGPGEPSYTPENDNDTRPVRLIRASWLLDFASSAGASEGMPKRQILESTDWKTIGIGTEENDWSAFLSTEEIEWKHAEGWELLEKVLNIVSVSYCWITAPHPDPVGKQLRDIAQLIEDNRSYSDTFKALGIFWDFGSLHQKERTTTEWAQFNTAISYMGLWYAHAMIVTYLLTGSPAPEIFYEKRGWTHFERSCAELVKANNAGGGKGTYRMIVDAGEESDRELPLTPELFSEKLAQKQFTTQADKENVVRLYTETFMNALRGIPQFTLQRIQLKRGDRYGDGDALAAVLSHCLSVTKLTLVDMGIHDPEMIAIAKVLRNCINVQEISFRGNHIGDNGAKAIEDEIPNWKTLQILHLEDNQIRDNGAKAVASAVLRCPSLTKLSISHNFGAVGYAALKEVTEKIQSGKVSGRTSGKVFELKFEHNEI